MCLIYTIIQLPTFIKGKDFSGYIFNAEHFVLLSIDNQNKRFTPTEADVIQTEKLIKNQINCLNKELLNQSDGCPKIHKNLKKYIRQYVGYIDSDGNKIIWVNFIWKNEVSNEKLKEDFIQVFDGCSHYWNLKVNLQENKIYDLKINGNG